MKLINIGFGSLVSEERLVAIVSPDSAPIKRMVQESRERGMLIDATYGRKTASIFIMDSDHVILSALPPEKFGVKVQSQQAEVTSKRPDAVRIFIAPPSWAELERRLTDRGTDSPDKIQKRLLRAKVEFQTAHTYDYFVINNTVEEAVEELNAIMTAEHCKPKERMEILSGK